MMFSRFTLTLIFFLHFEISICQNQNEDTSSLSNSCDIVNSFGLRIYKACFTEVQKLLRSRSVLKSLDIYPAGSTCGAPPSQYCRLEDIAADCNLSCDAEDPALTHSSDMAIDLSSHTWWQTISWLSYPQPLHVFYTISFHKLYRLTDNFIITFNSGRPQEMLIERSTDSGLSWQMWQYYAKDCLSAFNISAQSSIGTNPQSVFCSQLYSDVLPYTGGHVVFDVLSRYEIYLGAGFSDISMLYQSYNDTNWQRFLQFTDIRIQLLHPAADGEEVNEGVNLLTYYYAISDIQIVAECSCNLHASTCSLQDGRTVCNCEHNTAGGNCETCLPLYNNREWRPGYYVPVGAEPANECQECQCYGHSDVCVYNSTLGHGACTGCRDHTVGPFCDMCAVGFYINSSLPLNSTGLCADCQCNTNGIVDGDISCDTDGVCTCKENVGGAKCGSCIDNYYGLQLFGECRPCDCSTFGVIPGTICNPVSGVCECKNTTEGRTCSQCMDTYYGYPSAPNQECSPCSCVPGSSSSGSCAPLTGQCQCLPNLSGRVCDVVNTGFYLPSPLTEFKHNSTQCPSVYEVESTTTPGQWLSAVDVEKRLSVDCSEGESIWYTIHVNHRNHSSAIRDYLIGLKYKATANTTVTLSLTTRPGCPVEEELSFNFTLADSANYRLHLPEHLLSLSAECQYDVKITNSAPFSVTIDSLVLAADWSQFIIYSQVGGAIDAMLCYDWLEDRVNNATCRLLVHSSMSELYGSPQDCGCNPVGTIPDRICDPYGGQCRCLPGVKGRTCDQCLVGYHSLSTLGCTACSCDVIGSEHSVCDPNTGRCICRSHVATHSDTDYFGLSAASPRCETCVFASYNLSDTGCTSCNCNKIGSLTEQCKHNTGECQCKNGVGGAYCGQCRDGYYQFSQPGCRSCECDSRGSKNTTCDVATGQCPCKENTLGRRCNQCVAGTFGLSDANTAGCTPCYCSSHAKEQCLPAHGYSQTRIFHSAVTSLQDGWMFNTLLPSYGHLLQLFVMSPDNSIPISDTIITIASADPNNNELQHLTTQTIPAGIRVEIKLPLTEVYWVLKSTGAPPNQETFQYILQYQPVIKFEPSLEYSAVSVSIATKQDVTSSAEPHIGVENCSCSSNSNTEGLSCEFCKEGYRQYNSSLGSLSQCVPCQCSGRTDGAPLCHPTTGVCQNCRTGTTGVNCESCADHVTGSTCSSCEDGYWGLRTLGMCVVCKCDVTGSVNSTCDQLTGRCHCKQNVRGVKCNSCQLGHHSLGSGGCSGCHECYSLVGEKVDILSSGTEDINVTVSAISSQLLGMSNLTFSQDVHRVSQLLTRLSAELTSLAGQQSNISSTLTHWKSVSNNSTLPSHLTSSIHQWRDSLLTLNSSLSHSRNLSELVELRLHTDTASLDDLSVQLVNISRISCEAKLSTLENLLLLADNVTLGLQGGVRDLSQTLLDIGVATEASDNATATLTSTLGDVTLLEENITSTLAALTRVYDQVSDKREYFNQTLQLVGQYNIQINESLFTLQNNRPINGNYTSLYNSTTNLKAEAEVMNNMTRSAIHRLESTINTTAGYQSLVDDVYNKTEKLSVETERHLVDMQALHKKMKESVDSLEYDYTYLSDINRVTGNFQQQMMEVEESITRSLNTLRGIRNYTVLLADSTELIASRVSRAQRLSEQLHGESNDLYLQTVQQRGILTSLNSTVFDLKSQLDDLPAAEYWDKMNTTLYDILAVHNLTCNVSSNRIQELQTRFVGLEGETESHQLQVGDLSSQVSNIESALDLLESTDHNSAEDLTRTLEELSTTEASLSLPTVIENLRERVASQRKQISNAELRLDKIERSITEL